MNLFTTRAPEIDRDMKKREYYIIYTSFEGPSFGYIKWFFLLIRKIYIFCLIDTCKNQYSSITGNTPCCIRQYCLTVTYMRIFRNNSNRKKKN